VYHRIILIIKRSINIQHSINNQRFLKKVLNMVMKTLMMKRTTMSLISSKYNKKMRNLNVKN